MMIESAFLPLERVQARARTELDDSDSAYFNALLLLCEATVKIVTLGLVAGLEDDPEHHRYAALHTLVRADGIGEWQRVCDNVLTGPSAQFFCVEAGTEQRQLTERVRAGAWQYEALREINQCLKEIGANPDAIPPKVAGRSWLQAFAFLRNKTRGHGAVALERVSRALPHLEKSVALFIENFHLFGRQWAHLHKNLSRKYRVTRLSESATEFAYLRNTRTADFASGTYVYMGAPRRVDLFRTDPEGLDFFLANGGYSEKSFEYLSYSTGAGSYGDPTPYFEPAMSLPASHTAGYGNLECRMETFTNAPEVSKGYIRRRLEDDLISTLSNRERHPLVSLSGPGGAGKTSLALQAIHMLCQRESFEAIIWFSARDIDLLPEGPKPVQPGVLSEIDIAKAFVRLIAPERLKSKGFRPELFLSEVMAGQHGYGSILFVVDNLETVRRPAELISWLDTYIRLPNKLLVTTREKDFRGDYEIPVRGMETAEFEELVKVNAEDLGISDLLDGEYVTHLQQESEGNPYVAKILLGEIAKEGRAVKIRRIPGSRDDLLRALFERTFEHLSLPAQRVFLTLCAWRSTVPAIALEAVLLRPKNERMNVEEAVEELRRSSMVEISEGPGDSEHLLSATLFASEFGKRKLKLSPMRVAIKSDVLLLQEFGPGQRADTARGVERRIKQLFVNVANKVSSDHTQLEAFEPVLDFVANKSPSAWYYYAGLFEELGIEGALGRAIKCLRLYLESYAQITETEKIEAWRQIAKNHYRLGDLQSEARALVEACQFGAMPFRDLSNTARQVNRLLAKNELHFDTGERTEFIESLIAPMKGRIEEATATDLSRMAWLSLSAGDEVRAEWFARRGLEREPGNEHCLKLVERLTSGSAP